jgi:hypothetical protein
MVRAMDKPIPISLGLVEKNGSNISLILSNAGAGIRYRDFGGIRVARGSDDDPALGFCQVRHGVHRVHHQVQDDLPKLNTVALDWQNHRRITPTNSTFRAIARPEINLMVSSTVSLR